MRSIYVFGLFQTSAGKTVVSSTLCRGLLRRGFKVAPFKPRSGHNLWYQRRAFQRCKEEARLFCEDIIKLKEASRCTLPFEILNPVDALMAPLNAYAFLENNRSRDLYLKNPSTFSHLIVERYTSWREGKARTHLCVNEKNISNNVLSDRNYIRELTGIFDDVQTVRNVAEWASIFMRWGPDCISSCGERIAEGHDLIVVEGFNDAVCPAPELRYDAVIGVAPGVAAFYDPNDFHRVIEVKSMISGDPWGMRSRDVLAFIKPEETLKIPPVSADNLIEFDILSEKLKCIIEAALDRL